MLPVPLDAALECSILSIVSLLLAARVAGSRWAAALPSGNRSPSVPVRDADILESGLLRKQVPEYYGSISATLSFLQTIGLSCSLYSTFIFHSFNQHVSKSY